MSHTQTNHLRQRRTFYSNATALSVCGVALALLFTLAVTTTASAQTTCDVYGPSLSVPTGYGASYNVFNTAQMMVSIACNEDQSITVTSGNNDPLTYIYNQGYRYDAGTGNWVNFTYSCSNLIADAWCVGQVSKTLTNLPTADVSFLVSYTCQWSGTKWNCGCSNSSCSAHSWQLQGWEVPYSGGVDIPPGSTILFEQDFDGIPTVTAPHIIGEQEAADLLINLHGIYEDNKDYIMISPDPANTGRGNVIEAYHPLGDCGTHLSGGPDFDRLYSEVYLSYDMYFPPDYIAPFGTKFGLVTRREHPWESSYNDPTYYSFHPFNEYSDAAYRRGDMAGFIYYYTEERIQNAQPWNDSDPINLIHLSSDATYQTHLPLGEWFNVTGRVKMNTFTNGIGNRDGEMEVWLNGKRVLYQTGIRNSVHDDPGGWGETHLMSQYGGGCDEDKWRSPQDQSEYFDNLQVWAPAGA